MSVRGVRVGVVEKRMSCGGEWTRRCLGGWVGYS